MDLTSPLAPAGTQIARGRITALHDDGTVIVEAGGAHPCDVLCGGSEPYLLAPDDEVLVWLPLPTDAAARGVVLGRIGPSHATGGEPDEPPAELVLEARSRLVLRCGDGSIEVRDDGRILIRGIDLVSHAQRMNRIKGGAVAIN